MYYLCMILYNLGIIIRYYKYLLTILYIEWLDKSLGEHVISLIVQYPYHHYSCNLMITQVL